MIDAEHLEQSATSGKQGRLQDGWAIAFLRRVVQVFFDRPQKACA